MRSISLLTTLCVSLTLGASLAQAAPAKKSVLPAPRHLVDPYSTTPTLRGPAPGLKLEPPTLELLQPLTPAPTAGWTYLVYIVGDNDLEDYVTSDIETELAALGSNQDVQVLALADRSPAYSTASGDWTDTRLFHVMQGQLATEDAAVAAFGERNMGDPATLVDFLDFAHTYFPAQRTALVFWDHGWVWRPGQSNLDETNVDTLDQDEIAQALEVAGPVDVIGYDACLMATLEVADTVRPYAQALVASEDYVGYEGFRHDEVIAALRNNPSMDAQRMAVSLASSMNDRTITAIRLDERYDVLQAAVDQWSRLLLAKLPRYASAYEKAWTLSKKFGDPMTLDLKDAASKLRDRVGDAELKAASQAVMDAVDGVVLYEWHRDVYARAYGITIFWPNGPRDLDAPSSPEDDFDFYRRALSLSADTGWDEFVAAYAAR